jgi:alcohol dehydrogenase (cytochrome c)
MKLVSRGGALWIWAALVAGAGILILPDYRWRAIVAGRKLTGQITDVSWADLADIGARNSGFQLRKLAGSGNPYLSVQNPYTTDTDRARGQTLFGSTCAKCHGAAAEGGAGPSLVGHPLTHGDSDWAIYRTVTLGVGGTAMRGGLVERRDAWYLITYLHALAERGRLADWSDSDRSDPVSTEGVAEVTASALADSYNGQRFSRDTDINTGNVTRLAVQWIHQFASSQTPNESVPVAVRERLYVTAPTGIVLALDARTGSQIWAYHRSPPADLQLCCVAANRGVAVLGRRVYVTTLDAHLISLDAGSGRVLWDQTVASYAEGYSLTSAPLPVGDLVITGIAGGDYATRGFISAYDAGTGKLRWRFNTVPQPGEAGNETWGSGSWKSGGAATWGSGAYDPELGLVYWGVGNAAPVYDASRRPGDNLYSNSLLALQASTGKLAWYFQFSPGDDHDWDSIQTPALIDVEDNGQRRKLLAVANRNGWFYVLDRQSGRFVRGAPYAKQTWAVRLSPTGRPIPASNSHPSPQGTYLYPSVLGATNWWPSAYSPAAGLYYVNVIEDAGLFFLDQRQPKPRHGHLYTGGAMRVDEHKPSSDLVRAIDPFTATVRWERQNSTVTWAPRGGLLATGGGLVFGSDGTKLYALDARTGKELWSFDTGGHVSAAPMTFRVAGKQVVCVVAGQDLITFGLTGS